MLGGRWILSDETVTNTTLLGAASICGATTWACLGRYPVIVLTQPFLNSVGTMAFGVPPLLEPSLRFFNATFSLELKNSLEAEGFSWSYAASLSRALHPLWQPVGVFGARSTGLSVAFLEWPSCELHVYVDAILLLKSPRGNASWFDASGHATISVIFDDRGLHVESSTQGGVLSGWALDDWAPSETWVCGIGASA